MLAGGIKGQRLKLITAEYYKIFNLRKIFFMSLLHDFACYVDFNIVDFL